MAPAVKICLTFISGILFGRVAGLPVDWLVLIDGLVLSILLLAAVLPRFQHTVSVFLLLLLFTFGATWHEINVDLKPQNDISYFTNLDNLPIDPIITGIIDQPPEPRLEDTRFTIAVDTLRIGQATFHVTGTVLVTVKEPSTHFRQGDVVRLQNDLYMPSNSRNPGAFDYRRLLELKQIDALVNIWRYDQIAIIGHEPPAAFQRYLILPLRQHIIDAIDHHVTGAPAAFLKGILLGLRGGISPEVKETFSNTGVIHVLAISGLHVGLIAGLFFGFFRLLRLPENWASLAVIITLIVYCFLTGGSPSVVRASIMGSVILLGNVVNRQGDIYNSLALAAIIILVISPSDIFYVGFQMSFGATLAIVYLVPRMQSWLPSAWLPEKPATVGARFRKWALMLFLVSLAAQIGTTPMAVYYFNRLPLISLAANLVVVPMIGLILGLALAAVVFDAIHLFLGYSLMATVLAIVETLLGIVAWFADFPFAYITLPTPDPLTICLFIAIVAVGARVRESVRARRWALILLLIFANKLTWFQVAEQWDPKMEIVFLDVGQGDATFIKSPNGRTILIDGGDVEGDFSFGERVIAPYLRHRGLNRIDCVVLSHPHDDHLGGLVYILENFEVGHVLDAGQPYDSYRYQRFMSLIVAKNIDYRVVRENDQITGFAPLEIKVLHPSADYAEFYFAQDGFNTNDGSVTLKITYDAVDCLFTGDLEEDAEEELFDDPELDCEVVKAPHHGSITSSTLELIHATTPEVVYVPCGRHNKFKHPSAEVMRRYRSVGSNIFRADLHGALLVETDGQNLTYRPMLSVKPELILQARP